MFSLTSISLVLTSISLVGIKKIWFDQFLFVQHVFRRVNCDDSTATDLQFSDITKRPPVKEGA